MPTEKEVYASHAELYERLIQREDHQENILKEIQKRIALSGLDVADLGAGTGRVSRLLAPHVNFIYAFDVSLTCSPKLLVRSRNLVQPIGKRA